MSEILFIRHAETHLAGTFCGHSDPPINARGEEQIQALIASIDPHAISVVYSSDLQRATSTARAIATAFNVPMHTIPSLREIHFGAWESLTWRQIEALDPSYARRWVEEFPHLPAPGGETFAAFQTRALNQISQLPTLPSGKQTAVVTHAGVMRLILSASSACSQREVWARTKAYCSSFIHKQTAPPQETLQ